MSPVVENMNLESMKHNNTKDSSASSECEVFQKGNIIQTLQKKTVQYGAMIAWDTMNSMQFL